MNCKPLNILVAIAAIVCHITVINARETADTLMLQEVSVTSVKQGMNLRMQPVSATVLNATQVQRMGVLGIKAMSEIAPNFYMADYGTRMTSSIYVRGLGARLDQSVVGLNVDNVPFLNKDSYDFDLPDAARIEIARGPQTTLYGRNTMGGQINLYTLSPFQWQGIRILAEGATGPLARVSISRYGRIGSRLAMSVSLYGIWSDGFHNNSYNGCRVGIERTVSARWKTEWRPNNRMTMMNVTALGVTRQSGYPYAYEGTGRIEYNDTCFYRRNTFSDGLTLTWRSGDILLSSITSVQYLDDNMTLDQDFLPSSYFTLTQKRHEWSFTQDLVAKGRRNGYSWLAGVFGFYKGNSMSAPVTFLDDGIGSLIEQHRNDANPDYPISWDSRRFVLGSDFKYPVYGLATYHQSSYESGRWTVGCGLRLDYEHSALSYHSHTSTGFTIYDMTKPGQSEVLRHVPVDIDDRDRLSRHSVELLPRVTASWRIPMRQEGVVYLSFSEGYKSGGYNTQMFSDVLQQRIMGMMGLGADYSVDDVVSYKPERSANYEFGFHVSCADGKVETDMSAFFIDCRNQQLTMFPDGTTTGRITTNAGRTHSYGLEFSGRVTPLSHLSVNVNYGWTHARFRSYFNGRQDFRGKTVPYAPAHTLYIQGIWTVPLRGALHSLLLSADCRGVGPVYWDDDNSRKQPFYILPGVALTLQGDSWSLRAWVENLCDTKYNTFSFVSMGNRFYQRGKPATAGVTLQLHLQQ